MLEVLGIIGSIVLVDLVLSGDNALVIGAAAASLPRQQRYTAILAGGIGAIVLRILFTLAAALLLQLPLLQAIGGILLIAIAIKLLHDRERDLKKHEAAPARGRSIHIRWIWGEAGGPAGLCERAADDCRRRCDDEPG